MMEKLNLVVDAVGKLAAAFDAHPVGGAMVITLCALCLVGFVVQRP